MLHVDSGLEVPEALGREAAVLSGQDVIVVDVDVDLVRRGIMNDVVLELSIIYTRGEDFSSVVLHGTAVLIEYAHHEG